MKHFISGKIIFSFCDERCVSHKMNEKKKNVKIGTVARHGCASGWIKPFFELTKAEFLRVCSVESFVVSLLESRKVRNASFTRIKSRYAILTLWLILSFPCVTRLLDFLAMGWLPEMCLWDACIVASLIRTVLHNDSINFAYNKYFSSAKPQRCLATSNILGYIFANVLYLFITLVIIKNSTFISLA